ncbi:MAG: hypothetical protein QNJ98_14825 [Planctomycetota bacterium]|nr:hypothetical protein [Planctomycetota bacterium]
MRARSSRGHVSPWLLPSRRGHEARRVFRRLRWVLLPFGLVYIVLAAGIETSLSGEGTVWHQPAFALVAATWTVGLAFRTGSVWARTALPALLVLGVAVSQLVLFEAPTKNPWFNLNVVAAAIAFLLSWDALRIDAVRRLEPADEPTGLRGDTPAGRERIVPLALPAGRRLVATFGLIASAALLFFTIVLDLF